MARGSGNTNAKPLKTSLDAGASASTVHQDHVQNCSVLIKDATVWNTAAGEMQTDQKVKGLLSLTEFSSSKVIESVFHVTTTKSRCDMIIG